jgi:CMP-N-acetylneuraminic acid synthetase
MKVSKRLGAEVPFLRPKRISTSSSPTQAAIDHTLNFVKKTENYIPDVVVLLQPTSPHRTTEMINKSINLLKYSNASSVISVMKAKKHPLQSFRLKNGFLKPSNPYHEKKYYQRQLVPDLYYATGAIYTFWTKIFTKYNSIYGPKPKPLLVKDDELNIDIDSKFDLFVSEMVFQHWPGFKKLI